MTRALNLPVDAILPQVISSLQAHPNLIIEAPAGGGKTTRVPPALLPLVSGEILVLEPRRIAARMAARRVAEELGERLGETIGYNVRFETVGGPRTRLRFLTEAVLTRRFLSDPSLQGVDAVILDEFHERHLDTDFALALLKRLQRTRPALHIVVMSATLEASSIARYLDGCPILRSEGRLFPLTVEHLPYSPDPLARQVRQAVAATVRASLAGDILTFLPGAAEIRHAMRECAPLAQQAGLLMLPLHGDLSPAEQDRAVAPSSQRKLILSTNVAESSITVEGVRTVIDSGLARFAMHSPWTGLPTLHIGRISKASATQRAGRAGRTGPGHVLRLYPQEDFAQRPEHDTPEIARADLSELCLLLRALGFDHFSEIDWLESPSGLAVQTAESLLDRLGARGDLARTMARFPLPPRLSRLLIESIERGVGEDGCTVAALLGSGVRTDSTDLLAAMESPRDARLTQHLEQIRRVARPPKQLKHCDEALLKSVLVGFPDRVARRKADRQVLLSTGTAAETSAASPHDEFLVAIDAEDRKENPLPLIRMTAHIEPEWLIDLFPERMREHSSLTWNRAAERVDAVSALLYDDLVLQESRDAQPDAAAAAELLAEKALEISVDRFVDPAQLSQFQARATFAGLCEPDIEQALRELCSGLRSFADLRRAAKDLLPLLEQRLDARQLRENAPATLKLPTGRQTTVHYEHDRAPWISSRLQDFFGMRETPRIGPLKTPVVVHLLAPNHRPVQTTTDLAGFWKRLYPTVRRELMRRYPRHAWPEQP